MKRILCWLRIHDFGAIHTLVSGGPLGNGKRWCLASRCRRCHRIDILLEYDPTRVR